MRPLKESPSQTAGPFVLLGLRPSLAGLAPFPDLGVPSEAPGPRIRVEGTVFDGEGEPVRDCLIETWQADAGGVHPHPADPRHARAAPGFRGWARVVPDPATGLWSLDTVKPGPVPGPGGRPQAPHLSLWIVARGINLALRTRLYFADEAAANAADPLLSLVDPDRRPTLLARALGPGRYLFDLRLQGEGETVFLDQ